MVLFNTLLDNPPPYQAFTASNSANTLITIPARSLIFASRSDLDPTGGLGASGSFGVFVINFNTESTTDIARSYLMY
jgi:hypothetical protein